MATRKKVRLATGTFPKKRVIWLPTDLYNAIVKLALKYDISFSSTITHLLEAAIRRKSALTMTDEELLRYHRYIEDEMVGRGIKR